MRWLADAWDTSERLGDDGIDIRAVTVWSLLGSANWNTLLTAPGVYEPGVFDVSSGAPRATALARLMRGLPKGDSRHPVSRDAGWWRRPGRLLYPATATHPPDDRPPTSPPILVVGATGTLGRAVARACARRNLACVLAGRADLELRDVDSIARALDRHAPWAVVNAAGWVRVDDAERHREACDEVIFGGALRLSAAAGDHGIHTVNFSSDLVFDGRTTTPYVETDTPSPLGAYGCSKARMEEGVYGLRGKHLIIRTAAFFSPFDASNFAIAATSALSRGDPFLAARDLVVSPTYVPHLVDTMLDLLIDAETGIWHLTNETIVSWSSFAEKVGERVGLPAGLVEPVAATRLGFSALRPRFAAMVTARGSALPPLDVALNEFAAHYRRGPDGLHPVL